MVGIALSSTGIGNVAHADHGMGNCDCANSVCGQTGCGFFLPESNGCCSNSPPCVDCGGGTPAGSAGAACPADYPSYGWYWFCCKSGPSSPGMQLMGVSSTMNLWKCQDCCNTAHTSCKTFRDIVGTC
jgi:hypothetical protein